ncbi:hypothetical protein V2G26_007846 [Clonostachys chloroleuca]
MPLFCQEPSSFAYLGLGKKGPRSFRQHPTRLYIPEREPVRLGKSPFFLIYLFDKHLLVSGPGHASDSLILL